MRIHGACSVCMVLLVATRAPASFGEDPIVLGALYNSTGPQAGLDGPSLLGAKLAVDEANE